MNPTLKALKQNFYSPEEFMNIWPYAHSVAQKVFNSLLAHMSQSQQTNTPNNTATENNNSSPPTPK